MKYIDIHHPMFKPFHTLTKEDCENIILAQSKAFNKTVKKGKVIQDYSMYAPKWDELSQYVGLNSIWIYKEGGFDGLTIREVTLRLIVLHLKKL